MLRLIAGFTLFMMCDSFSRFYGGLVNRTHKLYEIKNIIHGILRFHTEPTEEPLWDDGEVPWDIRPDNKTSVKKNNPNKPNPPLISSSKNYRLAMLLQ